MAFQEPFPRFVFLAVFVSKVLAISLNTDLDRERKCHFRTISCPCNVFYGKIGGGFGVNVSYRECGIQFPLCQGCAHDATKATCSGKIVLAKCKRAYSLQQRQKRDTSSDPKQFHCYNGTIETPVNRTVGPPSVSIDGSSKTEKVDSDPSFTCDVYSNPAAEISWLLNGKALVVDQAKYSFSDCRQKLSIRDVGVADAGKYTCVVQNAYGKVTATVKLEVVPPPGPDITSVKLGGDRNSAYITSSINITCRSFYSDTSMFLKGSKLIKEQSGSHKYTYYQSTERSTQVTTLQIQNITVEDAGNYTCLAHKGGFRTEFKIFLLEVETCPAGYYCPWPSNKAVMCHPGTYRNASSNETEHCIMCKEGHYCGPGSRLPEPCPRGTYLPFNNGSSYKDCISCPDMAIAVEDGDDEPATRKEDCLPVHKNVTVPKEDEVASPSGTLTTSEILVVVGGTVGVFLVIASVLVYAVKRSHWLSSWVSKVSSKHQDLESYADTTVASRNGHLLQRLESSKQNTANDEIEKVPVEMEYEVRYDVFICYSSKDTSWVKTLLEELETRGFSCCIDFRDFVPGAAIVQNISEAIYHSRKTIAVLSPDFVESDWCSHELQKALTRIRFHQVVPIVHKHCEIPMVLQDRTYLDWENCLVKPYFWDQLENALNRSHDGVLL